MTDLTISDNLQFSVPAPITLERNFPSRAADCRHGLEINVTTSQRPMHALRNIGWCQGAADGRLLRGAVASEVARVAGIHTACFLPAAVLSRIACYRADDVSWRPKSSSSSAGNVWKSNSASARSASALYFSINALRRIALSALRIVINAKRKASARRR
jgi:hypothetical protein